MSAIGSARVVEPGYRYAAGFLERNERQAGEEQDETRFYVESRPHPNALTADLGAGIGRMAVRVSPDFAVEAFGQLARHCRRRLRGAETTVIQADMATVRLPKRAEYAYMAGRTVNTLVTPEIASAVLLNIRRNCYPGAVLAFDCVTPNGLLASVPCWNQVLLMRRTDYLADYISYLRDRDPRVVRQTVFTDRLMLGGRLVRRTYLGEFRERAYSGDEMQALLEASGWRPVQQSNGFECSAPSGDDELHVWKAVAV